MTDQVLRNIMRAYKEKEMINKQKSNEAENHVAYNAEVTRAVQFKDGKISFDLRVNGVTIYGMRYIEYMTKDGKPGSMLSFPSRKDEKSGKYFSHAWFPISRELQANIESQISEKVGYVDLRK